MESRVHAGCETSARLGLALFAGASESVAVLRAPMLEDMVTLSFDPVSQALMLTPAGAGATVEVEGRWQRLQIFVPVASLQAIAAELGLPAGSAVDFAPGPIEDVELVLRAETLLADLEGEVPVSALQLDETALELALRLITHHALIALPDGRLLTPGDPPAGSAWQRALVAEIIAELRDSPADACRILQGLFWKVIGERRAPNDNDLN